MDKYEVKAQMKRIRELDGLRAIAILLVLSCHYTGFVLLSGRLSGFGWMGVDVFFVLSGYLITTILLGLRENPHPYTTFYSRRAVRIFPPYFSVLLVIILCGLITHNHYFTWKYVLAQILFLQSAKKEYIPFLLSWVGHPVQMLGHMPSLLANAHHLAAGKPGLHASLMAQSDTYWSLSIEEFFYLFWAPVVLLFRRNAIVSIGIVICIVELILRWSFAATPAYFGIYFRFDGLVYGAFLALLLERWKHSRTPSWALGMFGAVIAICAAAMAAVLALLWPVVGFEIRDSPLFLSFGLSCISLGCAALVGILVLRAGTGWWPCRILRTSILQMIGTISYTMYLVEILAMLIVSQLFGSDSASLSLGQLLVRALFASVLTIAIAQLSWVCLERPLQRWKNSKLPEPSVVAGVPEHV